MSHNDIDTVQANSDELPVYNQSTLPDSAEIIMLTDEANYAYGGMLTAAYRLPLDRVIPNNTKQGLIYSITATNDDGADIPVPDDVVVPAYVESFEPYAIKRAQATDVTSKAHFLIISLDQNVDDNYIIQSDGFYTFPNGHSYEVGKTYYLSDSAPGGVTPVAPPGPSITQSVFYVVDSTTILIKIGE